MTAAETLGLALKYHQAGNLREAEPLYRQILQAEPRHADALHLLGVIALQSGRHEQAVAHIRSALLVKANFAEAECNLGAALQALGKLDEAVGCFRRAVQLKPGNAEMLNNLGNALRLQDRLVEAAANLQQALTLKPDYVGALTNLGLTMHKLGRLEEAVALHERAVRHLPNHAEAHVSLGIALHEQGRLDRAVACFQEAIRLKPDLVWAHFNLALAWLLQGNFAKGWSEFEWRWRRPDYVPRALTRPLWQGEPLAGRTILLHAEQGLGDTLQLARYVPLVKSCGAGSVLLECQYPLVRLLSQSGLGADRVLAQGEPPPAFDVHAPLFGLPRLLGTTSLERIPAQVPYLHCSAELVQRWRTRMEAIAPAASWKLRIGIFWQGDPNNKGDKWRSLPLEMFAPLGQAPGIRWFSLQKGTGSEQLYRHAGKFSHGPPFDLGAELADFADTAAALQSLDLVITVDTALAHLAGALGIRTWVLLPFAPDWRWLQERTDSPWYPTMRLFRQPQWGNWHEVFDRLAVAIAGLVSG